MITSVHNPKIQWVRRLQGHAKSRREDNAFIVEGVRLVEEALQANWETQLVLYTPELSPRGLALVEAFTERGASVEEVSRYVLEAAAGTEMPQGLLAVLSMHSLPLPAHLDFALIPDGVRDPGNLGTLLRTAAAAGVGAVLLPPGSADPYAPKVVRSAMGAHFRLPILSMQWEEIQALLKPHAPAVPFTLFLADARGELPYTQADFRPPTALLIGGEAEGAGSQAELLADVRVHIPMPGGAESLNAAVAASILMFEVVRQRNK